MGGYYRGDQRAEEGCCSRLCSCIKRIINCIICLIFLSVGGYLAWYFLGQPSLEDIKEFGEDLGDSLGDIKDFGDFTDVLGNLTGDLGELWDVDPFVGDNSTSAWKNNGKGLELELQNALDENWYQEFYMAVSDWEEGEPDALTLSTTIVAVDNACKPVDGLMKVCNGNYGATGWLGINEVLTVVATGEIVNSVAKMNEYYLLNAGNADRQYTMCHEIGHGFGLPHTDENFNNQDLGNCLDYSTRPQNNLHPGVVNFNRLREIYGTVGDRRLRSTVDRNSESHSILTAELRAEYELAIRELEEMRSNTDKFHVPGWRHLEEHPRGANYVRRLGEEHMLKVHMLHVLPDP